MESKNYQQILEKILILAKNKLQKQDRIVIGMNGIQGSGKTTLGLKLKEYFKLEGIILESISLDNFYLPYAERLKLPEIYKYRGPPGTHSTDLMVELLKKFKNNSQVLKIPTFDKSLHNGKGDRSGEIFLQPNTQVLLFDGWMQGYEPINNQSVIYEKLQNGLLILPNQKDTLNEYDYETIAFFSQQLYTYRKIWELHDCWIMLKPDSNQLSLKWRIEQENQLIAKKGQGMTEDEVYKFVTWYWSIMHPDLYVSLIYLIYRFLIYKVNVIQLYTQTLIEIILYRNDQPKNINFKCQIIHCKH